METEEGNMFFYQPRLKNCVNHFVATLGQPCHTISLYFVFQWIWHSSGRLQPPPPFSKISRGRVRVECLVLPLLLHILQEQLQDIDWHRGRVPAGPRSHLGPLVQTVSPGLCVHCVQGREIQVSVLFAEWQCHSICPHLIPWDWREVFETLAKHFTWLTGSF